MTNSALQNKGNFLDPGEFLVGLARFVFAFPKYLLDWPYSKVELMETDHDCLGAIGDVELEDFGRAVRRRKARPPWSGRGREMAMWNYRNYIFDGGKRTCLRRKCG